MTWDDVKRKLTSRKLWAALISFITALMVYRGTEAGTVESVSAIIWAGASLLAYIIGEGLVDHAAAGADVHVIVAPADEATDDG